MPELPEVETVRANLAPLLEGKRVTACRISWHRLVAHPSLEAFTAALCGRRVVRLARRGKYLLVQVEPPAWWVVHLRMTGALLYVPPAPASEGAAPAPGHLHASVRFGDGARLLYRDVRKFGRWYLLPAGPFRRATGAPKGLVKLGPEPLSGDFTPAYLQAAAAGRRVNIKSFLLDQSVVAGLGNIYADEVLHRAGISPVSEAGGLNGRAARRLHALISGVLTEAIQAGGTSLRDYRNGLGRPGGYVEHLRVYGRAGEPCPTCATAIVRDVIGGRGTAYCPACQVDLGEQSRGGVNG